MRATNTTRTRARSSPSSWPTAGQGIAARLLRDLISAADIAGLARLEGLVLRDNRRMLRFAHALGFGSSVDPADHTVARVVRALRD